MITSTIKWVTFMLAFIHIRILKVTGTSTAAPPGAGHLRPSENDKIVAATFAVLPS
jgi:hypothetical protein